MFDILKVKVDDYMKEEGIINRSEKLQSYIEENKLEFDMFVQEQTLDHHGYDWKHKFIVLRRYNGNKKNILIPEKVMEIGVGTPVFGELTRGTTIKLNNSAKIICENAFRECKADIQLSRNIFMIRDNAFRGCTGYITFKIQHHQLRVGKYAFADCQNIKCLPECFGDADISEGAFMNCQNLESLPDNIYDVESYVFKGCTSLKKIPNELRTIEKGAFEGCTAITSIPYKIKKIGQEAFKNCASLREITLGPNLIEIKENAFEGCPLERINIPLEVKELTHDFYHCSNLKYYYINGVPIKKFIGGVNFLKKKSNWIDAIDLGNKLDSLVLKNIVLGIPEEKLKDNFWNIINIDVLKNNLNTFRQVGMKDEEISTLIINNPMLLGSDFNTMIENFNYLMGQQIIPNQELQELFFEANNLNLTNKSILEQKEIIINYLNKYYQENKTLPTLFERLAFLPNDENRLELRDNLIYVSGMQLLSNMTVENRRKVKRMINRTEFENIVEEDNELLKKELKEKIAYIEFKGMYANHFDGIKTNFNRKLSGISSKYFEELIKSMEDISDKSYFNTFMKSLSTIQNWDNYDKKERATLLKNEIIGRLLYASIEMSFPSNITIPTTKEDKIRLYTILKQNMDNLDFNEVLEKAANPNIVFRNDKYIQLMLQIDPYSFDALRYNKTLQAEYCAYARENGYLFDDVELELQKTNIKSIQSQLKDAIKKYYQEQKNGIVHTKTEDELLNAIKNKSSNLGKNLNILLGTYHYSDIHLFEFLNNKIGIPKLPEEDNKTYLKQMEISIKQYLNKENVNLNEFLRMMDFYIRSNSEHILQYYKKEKIEEASKKVFDTSSEVKEHDRLLYSLYNLNKLAHSINEKHLRIDLIDKRLIDTDSEYKNLVQAIKAINELMDNGISLEETLKFIGIGEDKTNKLQKRVTNLLEIGNVNKLYQIALNGYKIVKNQITNFKIVGHFKDEVDINQRKNVKYKNGNNITKNLKVLLELKEQGVLNKNNLEKIKLLSSQRKLFFTTKQIIAEELMKKNINQLNIESFINMNEQEKIDFYKQNGYIVEIQRQPIRDENNQVIGWQPLLACYSKTFKESFSVHLVGLSKEVEEKVTNYINSNSYETTISHTVLIDPGLTLRNDQIDLNKIKNNDLLTKPGFANTDYEYLPTLYNYVKFDLHDKINATPSITDDNIKDWFKDFDLPKKIDLKQYITALKTNQSHQQHKITIPEYVSNTFKKLHVHLGIFPKSDKEQSKSK